MPTAGWRAGRRVASEATLVSSPLPHDPGETVGHLIERDLASARARRAYAANFVKEADEPAGNKKNLTR
jgi:hypothetical protein